MCKYVVNARVDLYTKVIHHACNWVYTYHKTCIYNLHGLLMCHVCCDQVVACVPYVPCVLESNPKVLFEAHWRTQVYVIVNMSVSCTTGKTSFLRLYHTQMQNPNTYVYQLYRLPRFLFGLKWCIDDSPITQQKYVYITTLSTIL